MLTRAPRSVDDTAAPVVMPIRDLEVDLRPTGDPRETDFPERDGSLERVVIVRPPQF